MKPIKLFLVDDHKLIRDAIRVYFQDNENFEILGETNNGAKALKELEAERPDVVLTDISMPEMDGLELTKVIKDKWPDIKVIIVSMLADYRNVKKAMNEGVDGYLLKSSGETEIKNAVEKVFSGSRYFTEEITQVVMDGLSGNVPAKPKRLAKEIPLTSREKDVLRLIVKEYSNQEIADELFISPRTVDAHKRNLLEKTGSKNVAGLVIYAMEKKLFNDM